jgi:hypothetical protein
LPLPLRNRLAELVLAGFDDPEARATVAGVARACLTDPAAMDPADAARLTELGWFEPAGPGRVRMVGAYRAHRDGLAERAGRGAALLAGWRDRSDEPLARTLARAAALADRELFFEVHELLEPPWFRAEEPLRTALQGLIQIAVALHHAGSGNLAGARSLLAEGGEKVAAAGASLPFDVTRWLEELRQLRAALVTGGPGRGAIPRWPRPTATRGEETPWPCC